MNWKKCCNDGTDPRDAYKSGGNVNPSFDVAPNTSVPMTYYFEGERHSATVDDVVITASIAYSAYYPGTNSAVVTPPDAVHKLTVYQVDLDVDSNNNEGFDFTPGSDNEDQIEASTTDPGKVIPTRVSGDANGDGIPDWQNGVDGQPSAYIYARFVPVWITLPEPYDISTATLTFTYDEAKPGAGTPGLRLWTKNGTEARTTANNLIPSGSAKTLSQLGAASGSRTAKLYLEAVVLAGQSYSGKKPITAVATQSGALSAEDKVNVFVIPVEMITPAGDPVAAPVDGLDGTGTVPAGANEFTFSGASPGVLTMQLKARATGIGVLPTAEQAMFRFFMDSIGASAFAWDAANPNGQATVTGDILTAKATYTGLPQSNSDFGTKFAVISFASMAGVGESFEVFFPKTATNHPGAGARTDPNWFYYWKEGGVCGIQNDAIYDGSIDFGQTTPEVSSIVSFGPLAAESDTPLPPLTSSYGSLSLGVNSDGIHTCAITAIHEQHHIVLYERYDNNWWGRTFGNDDKDIIVNSDEPSLDAIASDPTKEDTYGMGGSYSTYGDEEVRCRSKEAGVLKGTHYFPSLDWANPGCQSRTRFGPVP